MSVRRVYRDERGGVLPLFALFLPLVLLLLGLAADAGILLAARGTAHAIADVAALAGVQELDLDRLARGERYILPVPAVLQARTVALRNLAENGLLSGTTRVEAEVINASTRTPRRHPWTGRLLTDPTLAVAIQVDLPLHFPSTALHRAPVAARADASVLPRRRD